MNSWNKLAAVLLLLFTALISSCTSYKQVPYLQEAEHFKSQLNPEMYDAKIMPKDLLTVIVSCEDPVLAVPFNFVAATRGTQNVVTEVSMGSRGTLQSYLVDNDGYIEMPVLGRVKIGGLNKREAEEVIANRVKAYIKAPMVTVRMANYKISVLGEVKHPSTFTVPNEKINIFEALALAGDMTIYGMRTNVKLIREQSDGEKHIEILDLTSSDIINSPYYYLQQNDILYVQPNKTKAKNSDISQSTTIWISVTSILLSVANLVIAITN